MTSPNAPETSAIVLTHLQRKAAVDPAEFFTPREVADVVGKGYSTVTAALRDLRDAGHVRSETRGRATVWQATNPATSNPGHAVAGDIDTSETATAVDLSGDALTMAGAGVDLNVTAPAETETNEQAEASAAANDSWAAGDDPDALPRRAETPAGPPVDDIEGDPAGPVSVYAETAASLGGPVAPVIPGQPVADDMDAHITPAPAGTTAWDAMEALMRDVTNPPARPAATVDLTPATAAFGAGPETPAPVNDTDEPVAPVSAPPAGAGLDDVLGFMETVRPMPEAAEETVEQVRPRSAAPGSSTARRGEAGRRNDWGRGELAAAALAYVLAKGGPAKPSEVARAINGFTGSVDFALKQMAKKGTLERVPGDGPAQYQAPSGK